MDLHCRERGLLDCILETDSSPQLGCASAVNGAGRWHLATLGRMAERHAHAGPGTARALADIRTAERELVGNLPIGPLLGCGEHPASLGGPAAQQALEADGR